MKNISLSVSFKVIIGLLVVSFGILSCRKLDYDKPTISWNSNIGDKLSVSQDEINEWFRTNLPLSSLDKAHADMLLGIQWSKAKQTTIRGMQVVKVPSGEGHYFVFYKTNSQASLRVYSYFINNDHPGASKFTGKLYWYNYRTFQLRGMQYVNGIAKNPQILNYPGEDELKSIKVELSMKIKSPENKVSIVVMGQTRFQKLLASMIWYMTHMNLESFTIRFNQDEADFGSSGYTPYETDFTAPEVEKMLSDLGGVSGTWEDYNPSSAATELGGMLNLTQAEIDWLVGPYSPTGFMSSMYNYVMEATTTTQLSYYELLTAASRHIKLMVADGDYRTLVINSFGGSSGLPWWENISLLEIPSNVDMIVNGTTDYFEELGFYDNEGHSDPGDSNPSPTYTDPFWHLENPLELGGFNNSVALTFKVANRNQPVHLALNEALRNTLIDVNVNLPFPLAPIRQLYITSTSEGSNISTHDENSNHYRGTAVDISRINRVPVYLLPSTHPWVKNMQLEFEQELNRWENYGPYMLHYNGSYHYVGGHRDHLHFAVRP